MSADRPSPRRRPSEPDRSRQALGSWGEARAATEYRRRGYLVLDRNWRCRAGEIDLVVARESTIVFCEVKTRSTARHGPPAGAVTVAKQRRLRRLAMMWLAAHPDLPAAQRKRLRFDVVAIVGTRLRVIEGAF